MQIGHALRPEGTLANRKVERKLHPHRSRVPLDVADLGHEKTPFRHPTNGCQGARGV